MSSDLANDVSATKFVFRSYDWLFSFYQETYIAVIDCRSQGNEDDENDTNVYALGDQCRQYLEITTNKQLLEEGEERTAVIAQVIKPF